MYDNVYTLSEPLCDDVHEVLNGKVFSIYVDEDGQIMFTCIGETVPCLQSTRIADVTEEEDGSKMTIKTESGTIYQLINLSTLLPTQSSHRIHSYIDPIIGHVTATHSKNSVTIGGTALPERIKFITPLISRKQFLGFLRRSDYMLISNHNPIDGYYTKIDGFGHNMVWIYTVTKKVEPAPTEVNNG